MPAGRAVRARTPQARNRARPIEGSSLVSQTQADWAKLGIDGSGIADEPPGPGFKGMPRLTLPMLARLQDFPDNWEFAGDPRSVMRQIANAFPPRLARAMGLSLMRVLTGEEVDRSAAFEVAYPLSSPDLAEFRLWPEDRLQRELEEPPEPIL